MTHYLQRLLDRSAPATIPALRPALPSRSPVTEADQRLHDPDLASALLATRPVLGFEPADFDPFADDTLDDNLLGADLPTPPAPRARFPARSTLATAPIADNRSEDSAPPLPTPGDLARILPPPAEATRTPVAPAPAAALPHQAIPPQRQDQPRPEPSAATVPPASRSASPEPKPEPSQAVLALRAPPPAPASPLTPTTSRPGLPAASTDAETPAAWPAAEIAVPLLRPIPLPLPEPPTAPNAARPLTPASVTPPIPIGSVGPAPETRPSAAQADRRPMPATAEAVSRIGPLTPRRRTHLVFGLRRR